MPVASLLRLAQASKESSADCLAELESRPDIGLRIANKIPVQDLERVLKHKDTIRLRYAPKYGHFHPADPVGAVRVTVTAVVEFPRRLLVDLVGMTRPCMLTFTGLRAIQDLHVVFPRAGGKLVVRDSDSLRRLECSGDVEITGCRNLRDLVGRKCVLLGGIPKIDTLRSCAIRPRTHNPVCEMAVVAAPVSDFKKAFFGKTTYMVLTDYEPGDVDCVPNAATVHVDGRKMTASDKAALRRDAVTLRKNVFVTD